MEKQQYLWATMLFLLLGCSCKKQEQVEFVNMVPLVPVDITPVQEKYQVGDTLWLTADFFDSLIYPRTAFCFFA